MIKKIKELIDYNETLKQIMKKKEDALNNKINEIEQKLVYGAIQLSDENKSNEEIAAGQEHEIERLIGENKRLENEYNDLQRAGAQQLKELIRTNESLNKTVTSQNEQIDQLVDENNSLKREMADKGKKVQQLTNENSSLKSQILSKESVIQKLINENNSLHVEVETKEKGSKYLNGKIVNKDNKIKNAINPIKIFTSAEFEIL